MSDNGSQRSVKKSVLDQGMFQFKADKKQRLRLHRNPSSQKSFISINANSSIDESWNHTMDLKTIDLSALSQGLSRNQHRSSSMSVLDMHYESYTNKHPGASMTRDNSQMDLIIQHGSIATDPDKQS